MHDFTVLLLELRLQVELLIISIARFHELVVFVSDVSSVEASFGPMVKFLEHFFLLSNVDIILTESVDVT